MIPSRWRTLPKLFWMFLKVNLLTTSGPASIGLLYRETVGSLMTESQFVEAVGFSNLLPGSEALKLALFVGHAACGVPGTLVALLASILPPTLVMLTAVSLLQQAQGAAWLQGFVRGLSPAVAMLMVYVAWKILRSEKNAPLRALLFACVALAALLLAVPSPIVLVGAGLLGVMLIR